MPESKNQSNQQTCPCNPKLLPFTQTPLSPIPLSLAPSPPRRSCHRSKFVIASTSPRLWTQRPYRQIRRRCWCRKLVDALPRPKAMFQRRILKLLHLHPHLQFVLTAMGPSREGRCRRAHATSIHPPHDRRGSTAHRHH